MTARYGGKSMMDQKDPYRGFVLPRHTKEQNEAFSAYIEELCKESPVIGTNRKSRKKHRARAAAVHFAKVGSIGEAFAQAVYGGLRKRDLRAAEALLFG